MCARAHRDSRSFGDMWEPFPTDSHSDAPMHRDTEAEQEGPRAGTGEEDPAPPTVLIASRMIGGVGERWLACFLRAWTAVSAPSRGDWRRCQTSQQPLPLTVVYPHSDSAREALQVRRLPWGVRVR